ncbi:MAG: signal peptidase II [Verrucomicrobia bacterium]|nr:MAG: signal peptidase II [Verrucomicrobiota bacterium]TAE88043.1 MAG: signal peptidase II [Verrucomicrobiota bacterium]TAF26267.1 MAG: signal peptidase II [Verrucomicrobiota bacterium]TAF41823.1 MAG: signal peptidase II [Verrucomicrobiota bacterium]
MPSDAGMKKEWGIGWILLLLTLPLYLLDQWSKFWIVGRFPEPLPGQFSSGVEDPVIDGFFNIVRVHNQGVAFGFGNGSDWAPIVFLAVPFIALVLITLGLRKQFFVGNWGRVAVGLLLCGIFGNLTDRLIQGSKLSYMEGQPLWERLKAGYVVDFLDFTLPLVNYRWPSFNVADSCIFVAAFVLFFSGLKADLKKAE